MVKRIALLTSQVAPFQIELAKAINQTGRAIYKVFFLKAKNDRPPHWLDIEDDIKRYAEIVPQDYRDADAVAWAVKALASFQPDTIIVGGMRGPQMTAALQYRKSQAHKIWCGAWMEQPLVQPSLFKRAIRRVAYRVQLSRLDFVLAIGDRAHRYYRGCNRNTHFVPYGSDLQVCLDRRLPKLSEDKMRFLFSGGLVARHNFDLIMGGFRDLVRKHGPTFSFVVSGDGPEQQKIDRYCEETPALKEVVVYDRVFKRWPDRLRPFCEADVFIYPTDHAGWGIVVPEAMAAGLLVIAKPGAEAARFLIRDNDNGLMIGEEKGSFFAALERCLQEPQWVSDVGIKARASALACDAPAVARQMLDTVRIATGCDQLN